MKVLKKLFSVILCVASIGCMLHYTAKKTTVDVRYMGIVDYEEAEGEENIETNCVISISGTKYNYLFRDDVFSGVVKFNDVILHTFDNEIVTDDAIITVNTADLQTPDVKEDYQIAISNDFASCVVQYTASTDSNLSYTAAAPAISLEEANVIVANLLPQ